MSLFSQLGKKGFHKREKDHCLYQGGKKRKQKKKIRGGKGSKRRPASSFERRRLQEGGRRESPGQERRATVAPVFAHGKKTPNAVSSGE